MFNDIMQIWTMWQWVNTIRTIFLSTFVYFGFIMIHVGKGFSFPSSVYLCGALLSGRMIVNKKKLFCHQFKYLQFQLWKQQSDTISLLAYFFYQNLFYSSILIFVVVKRNFGLRFYLLPSASYAFCAFYRRHFIEILRHYSCSGTNLRLARRRVRYHYK